MWHSILRMRRRNYRTGFTLLEMMIVLGLVAILTSATAVYNKDIGRQIGVAQQHARVLGLFVKARSAGFIIPKTTVPVCGYGVHIDPDARTFVYFKDLCDAANHVYDGPIELIEQTTLDASLIVSSDASDVVFIPPFGKVLIDAVDTRSAATVTVTSASAGVSRQVKINAYGQITEDSVMN